MPKPSLLDEWDIPRGELLELLPERWPGLSRSLDTLKRVDSLAVAVVRRILGSCYAALLENDVAEQRQALLELLGGAVVTRDEHETRVSGLIAANNRELERGREARAFARKVATMTDVEVDFEPVRDLRTEARIVTGDYPGPSHWRPRYGANERERAAFMLQQAQRNGHSAAEVVDLVAEALGMERA